jgi:hypothetical protein
MVLPQAKPFQMSPNFRGSTPSNNPRPEPSRVRRDQPEPVQLKSRALWLNPTEILQKANLGHLSNHLGIFLSEKAVLYEINNTEATNNAQNALTNLQETRNLCLRTADFAARKREDTTYGPRKGEGRRVRPKSQGDHRGIRKAQAHPWHRGEAQEITIARSHRGRRRRRRSETAIPGQEEDEAEGGGSNGREGEELRRLQSNGRTGGGGGVGSIGVFGSGLCSKTKTKTKGREGRTGKWKEAK